MKIKEESIVKPLPDEELFIEFEDNYELQLPDEYKMFMKRYNGAIPLSKYFSAHGNEYVVERFLCMLESPRADAENGGYDIEVILAQIDTRLVDDGDMVGTNMVPIAALFAGDFLCLDYRKTSNPQICVWFHEESEELSPVTKDVATSFGEFLKMLKE